jgi:trk system potassium uptake protein TrkH
MYELVSPVNMATVIKYLGQIMVAIGAILLVPLIMALIFGDLWIALVYGAIALGIVVLGYALHHLLPDADLQWKEALVIAALIFPLSSVISAIPFMLSTGMAPLDALFEAVSGITTTGLSVAPVDAGPVFLFARSWLQWIGGIGIVLIVLSIPLIHPGTSAIRLYTANVGEEKLRPSVAATAVLLAKIYISLTLVAFLLLLFGGMQPFDAICHALASVSTGGFSTRAESIGAFPGFFIPLLIIISFVMGATNFALYPQILKKPRDFFSSVQLRVFFIIAILGSAFLALTMLDNTPVIEAVWASVFQSFSALTTAGFATVDISVLPDSSKGILTVLMWIGGSMGSTAGGIKILRLLILLKIIHLVFIRFFLPREALTPLKVGEDVIEPDETYQILSFIVLYMMVLVVSSFIFMLHGIEMGDALFEVSSALGTVGLSCGITGPSMPLILKVVLIVDMLLGRIEIIPLGILFFPRTWIKR